MVHSSSFIELATQWERIQNKMASIEKTPRDFGSGDLINCSEVNMLMAIGNYAGANVTDLAGHSGITKSAVSQMVSKLEKRELVEKYQDPGNDKEIFLRLTPRGRIAFLGHEQYHLKIHARIERKLREMTEDEFRILQDFFRIIEETADEAIRDFR